VQVPLLTVKADGAVVAESTLRLRSLGIVALAYLLGPLVGLTVWGGLLYLEASHDRDFDPAQARTGWFLALAVGTPFCMLVELVFVTPLLIWFNRLRWRWLNGWTGAMFGFLLGAILWFLMTASSPTPSPDQFTGGLEVCTYYQNAEPSCSHAGPPPKPLPPHARIWETHGHWTPLGWAHVLIEAAKAGLVGLIAALVFRLIAVRKSEAQPAAART
jgi:hypothetical protein